MKNRTVPAVSERFSRAPLEAEEVLRVAYTHAADIDVLSEVHELSEYEDATTDAERDAIDRKYQMYASNSASELQRVILAYKTAYDNSFWTD